jgi:hypothetical protein
MIEELLALELTIWGFLIALGSSDWWKAREDPLRAYVLKRALICTVMLGWLWPVTLAYGLIIDAVERWVP